MCDTREARKRHFQTRFAGLRSRLRPWINRRPLFDSADRPPPALANSCRLRRRPLAGHAHANCRRPQSPSALTALPLHHSAAINRQPPNCPPNRRRIAAQSPAEPSPPSARHLPNACHSSRWAPAAPSCYRTACPPSRPPNRPPTSASRPPRPLPARPPARPATAEPPANHPPATETAACAELMLSVRSC